VLDQLADADSELQSKRTVQSGDVGSSIQHLTYEDLEAYVAGRLASARLQHCRTHLESCDACRAELEDLRTFNRDFSGLPPAWPRSWPTDLLSMRYCRKSSAGNLPNDLGPA
jgi:hypothetical protein